MRGVWLPVVACWLVWTCVMTASPVSAQPHHNVKQMKQMVRLFQGLRRTVKTRLMDLTVRISSMYTEPDAALETLLADIATAKLGFTDAWDVVDLIAQNLKQPPVSAVKVIAAKRYPGNNHVFFTNVREDFMMDFNAGLSRVAVMRSGLYMLEVKIQTNNFYGAYFDFDWTDAGGALIKSFTLWTGSLETTATNDMSEKVKFLKA
nr:hypothetical protein BaRGS_003320 [Batillaria attramentaria]